MRFRSTLLIFSFCILSFGTAQAEPRHIFLVRHAEKNSDYERTLSAKGYQRARALAKYFTSDDFKKRYGTPDALFAADDSGGRSRRSIETLEPTAKILGLKVNSDYEKFTEKVMIEEILEDPELKDQTVVIAWAHSRIHKFLKPFRDEGIDLPDEWPGGVYDRIWALHRGPKGEWRFEDRPQRLLPGDSEE